MAAGSDHDRDLFFESSSSKNSLVLIISTSESSCTPGPPNSASGNITTWSQAAAISEASDNACDGM